MCLHKTARIYRKSVIFQINAGLYNRMTVMTTAKAYDFLTFRPSSCYKRSAYRNFVIR